MKFRAVTIYVNREAVINIYETAAHVSYVEAVKAFMRLGEPHIRLSIESGKIGVHYILDNFSWLLDSNKEMLAIVIKHAINYKFLEETD